MKKLVSILIAVLLLSAMPVLAEGADMPSDDWIDMQVKIGDTVYTLAGSPDILDAQGLTHDELRVGYWNPVSDGEVSFAVVLDALHRDLATPQTSFICGYQLKRKDVPSATLPGGVDLATATLADVRAAYGEPSYESNYGNGSNLSYYFVRDYVKYRFSFEGDIESSPLRDIEVTTTIPTSFGIEFAPAAPQADLPDPSALAPGQFIMDGCLYNAAGLTARDLVADGWVLDAAAAEEELKPMGGRTFSIMGVNGILYNGRGMAKAMLYNTADSETGASCLGVDGAVFSMAANVSDNTSFVVTGGLTFGCTLEDVTAVFGADYSEDAREGYTIYTFTIDNTRTVFRTDSEGIVYYIEVQA